MSHAQGYRPETPPSVNDERMKEILDYVLHEFETIARSLMDFQLLRLQVLSVEPEKPRNGMIVVADGTTWNPGGGAGVYAYISGAWVKL